MPGQLVRRWRKGTGGQLASVLAVPVNVAVLPLDVDRRQFAARVEQLSAEGVQSSGVTEGHLKNLAVVAVGQADVYGLFKGTELHAHLGIACPDPQGYFKFFA